MNFTRSLSLALLIAAFGAPSPAAQHQAHHPAAAASAPASKATSSKANPDVERMDTQMKAMGAMHDQMMAARTPEARNALMAEHMKTMQEGMAMMNGMGGMNGNMASHPQMMEKRMEMMQSMMQMMMDRLPANPAQ